MRKIRFFILCLLLTGSRKDVVVLADSISQPSPLLRGCIRYTDPLSSVPEYTIFFRGNRAKSNSEGFYSLPIDNVEKIKKMSLVITRNVTYRFKSTNTIDAMMVPQGKEYKYYILEKNDLDEWAIHESSLAKGKNIIPDDAIVVRISPRYVDHIEPWKINLSHSVVKLPVIVLKNETENKKVKRASVKSLLYSLDDGVIHKPYTEERQVQKDPKIASKVKVSLVR